MLFDTLPERYIGPCNIRNHDCRQRLPAHDSRRVPFTTPLVIVLGLGHLSVVYAPNKEASLRYRSPERSIPFSYRRPGQARAPG